ncbi:MAG: hypothetical protein COT89_01085 [Candidatus Colwellbacteria bacterium CG10_big_fil_rev_8_21_14_0_10_42_22]|uniref:Uncharacterized protein n=1 Tax=Candidatus Colwellbacteria bacterium CG10_big_fil_rev_8_21_14_0_10_42_22 TaxID=1974540 RepID=A0A2H0VGA5_9BACT|nr:MAG: hypothetical protein COT89_01085 [Candidatus Colwellbacteria bacterium CG10_big_fil_rev_8_21_14_0_10_42_22]
MKIESFGEAEVEEDDLSAEENTDESLVGETELSEESSKQEDLILLVEELEKIIEKSKNSNEEDIKEPKQELSIQEYEDIGDIRIESWGEKKARKKLVGILQSWDGVDTSILDSKHLDDLVDHLIELIARDRMEDIGELGEISDIPEIEEMWSSAEFLRGVIRATTSITNEDFIKKNSKDSTASTTGQEDLPRVAKLLRRKLFNIVGLSRKETKSIWDSISTRINYEDIQKTADEMTQLVNNTLMSMVYLEERSPGSVKILHTKYGIRFFGRYRPSHLIRQAEGKLKQESPTVMYTATNDHNGALDRMWELFDALRLPKHTIVIEGASLIEVGRRLVRLSRENGPIKELVIAGHGNSYSVLLGTDAFEKAQIEKSKGIKRLVERGVFQDKPSIIFFSCNTGITGGIASKFDKAIGANARIQAPDIAPLGIDRRTYREGRVKYRKKRIAAKGISGKRDKWETVDAVEY